MCSYANDISPLCSRLETLTGSRCMCHWRLAWTTRPRWTIWQTTLLGVADTQVVTRRRTVRRRPLMKEWPTRGRWLLNRLLLRQRHQEQFQDLCLAREPQKAEHPSATDLLESSTMMTKRKRRPLPWSTDPAAARISPRAMVVRFTRTHLPRTPSKHD